MKFYVQTTVQQHQRDLPIVNREHQYAYLRNQKIRLTSVEIWFTSAALGRSILAFVVKCTPRLYIEPIRAARARTPVVIERQKNCFQSDE